MWSFQLKIKNRAQILKGYTIDDRECLFVFSVFNLAAWSHWNAAAFILHRKYKIMERSLNPIIALLTALRHQNRIS